MTRNRYFHSQEPLQSHEHLQLQNDRVHGPSTLFNPTRAYFTHLRLPSKAGASSDSQIRRPSDKAKDHQDVATATASTGVSNLEYKWRSRDNRKGRHALVVKPAAKPDFTVPSRTSTIQATLQGIIRMCTYFPYWDISYMVAVIFTLGSVIWVINGFFAWLPLVRPGSEFPNEILYGGGITAFIGATVFEIGSILLVLEAINANQEGCFGWAIDRAFTELLDHDKGSGGEANHSTPPNASSPNPATAALKPDPSSCSHHHSNNSNLVGKGTSPSSSPSSSWHWLPTLSTPSIHDLGFLAAATQLLAATIFWIAGLTSLPPLQSSLSAPHRSAAALNCAYWLPQIVGGAGFMLSGALYMLESSHRWYWPDFGTLGWWIGAWNFVGAVGFTLCGALGPAAGGNGGVLYQLSLATFWGSWAFLVGSALQWFESLDKWPVEHGVGGGRDRAKEGRVA